MRAAGAAVQIGEIALAFVPSQITAGDFKFATGSAGSCMLVLQTVLWPLVIAAAPSNLVLRGGTHSPMARSLSFLQQLAPVFARQGLVLFNIEVLRQGFTQQVVVTPSCACNRRCRVWRPSTL